ncbi:MAG: LPS export ABC transporter periplasmic protein LptC [bacterium]|nr:LPS export ABC transporter periplasmic protein LptC [bacterium]
MITFSVGAGLKPALSEEIIQEFSLIKTDEVKKKWNLEAESADLSGDPIIKLYDVKLSIFEEQKVTIHLTGEQGYINKKTEDIHLEKNIIGKRTDGTEIKTAYIDWIAKAETFDTNAKVLITRKNIRLTGHGLKAAPKLKIMYIKKFPVMEISREDTSEN